MGTLREGMKKKILANHPADMPAWMLNAQGLPNRKYVTETELEIIDLIRTNHEYSKADLVTVTQYSRTKIANCIDALVEKQILIANEEDVYTGGRRSKTFSLNGNLCLLAGVDIGATSIDIAIADATSKILVRHSEPALVINGPIKILGRVCSLLESLLIEHGYAVEQLSDIGIGVPGPVDFSAGTLVSPPIMPGWDRYPIIETVQQWFPSSNVVVDNDVNVMAFGEIYQGAGVGINNLIFVKVGTGIGAGIICEGKIYRGFNGCAGDIGHIAVNHTGPICHCGNKGCLESVAAGPAIAERSLSAVHAGKSSILSKFYEKNNGTLRAEDIGAAAREGDAFALEVIRESGQAIGEVLASLVNFYNPEMIVIGGGVSNLGNLLLSTIRQAVLNRSLPLATRDLQIVFSEIVENAGVIGAVNLAMDYMYTLTTTQNDRSGA